MSIDEGGDSGLAILDDDSEPSLVDLSDADADVPKAKNSSAICVPTTNKSLLKTLSTKSRAPILSNRALFLLFCRVAKSARLDLFHECQKPHLSFRGASATEESAAFHLSSN
jgi:hypothetical protein